VISSGIVFAVAFSSIILKFIINNGEFKMAEENGTGSNLIWALTTIIVVAIIAGALYYSGFLGGTKKEKIDINISAPTSGNK
jgi:hypothetical protein